MWRGIEVVITRRSWKPFVREGAWVRIPPSPLEKLPTGLLVVFYIRHRAKHMIEQYLEKYPSWPKGLPWKGSRSLIAARGFKSLLLRLSDKPTHSGLSRLLYADIVYEKASEKMLEKIEKSSWHIMAKDDIMSRLTRKRQTTQNLDNWTIDNNPENFLKERISEQNGTSKRCPTLKQ